jgi:GT2 family glycosyltransferase
VSARVTLVMVVFNQLPLTRACLDSLDSTREPFALVVVDNGSTDDTRDFFARFRPRYPVRYETEGGGGSVIAALNRGWRLADTAHVCFLHNDTELGDADWLGKLLAPLGDGRAGLTGLYGVKRVRRDGRYVGRTIVHSLAPAPTVALAGEEVAVVDGVCLCVRRSLLEAVGGFDEGYGFFHGYDRDLSFAVREHGETCHVVRSSFLHRGGGTRTEGFARDPARARADRAARAAALDRFVTKWGHRLPCDVRPLATRVGDWARAKGLRA